MMAIAAIASLTTACGSSGDKGGVSAVNGVDLVDPGRLTICTDAPYKPFEYPDPTKPSGYSGFDIDILEVIAKKLDLDLTVKDLGFDGLQSGASLTARQCDVVASAMTITDAREAKLDFTEPYYDSKQSLLTSPDSGITSLKDLAGKKLGVQQGTTGADYAKKSVPDDVEIVSFPSDAELYAALESRGIKAVLQDLPVNLEHTKNGRFVDVEEYATDEHYGFAVREKGSEGMLKELNSQLKAMRTGGAYDKLYNKYFSS